MGAASGLPPIFLLPATTCLSSSGPSPGSALSPTNRLSTSSFLKPGPRETKALFLGTLSTLPPHPNPSPENKQKQFCNCTGSLV